MPTRRTGTQLVVVHWRRSGSLANLTLAFAQERFRGADGQVAEGMEERNRDLRLLSRVSVPGFRVIIEVPMKYTTFSSASDTALLVWTLVLFSVPGMAQSNAPAVLPGKGLAQHDFFYAGESKTERMSIVRGGKIVWSYTHSGQGEISDAVLEPNGNILFAHQFGITEISSDKKVVWNFDAPAQTEIHTAQPFGTGRVWFIQNGNPAKFVVMQKASGKIEHQFELPVKNPDSVHGDRKSVV